MPPFGPAAEQDETEIRRNKLKRYLSLFRTSPAEHCPITLPSYSHTNHILPKSSFNTDSIILCSCSAVVLNSPGRYLHRASVAFVLLKEYWGLGIGGKMMQECIKWCEAHNIEQIELDVLKHNERAIAMYLRLSRSAIRDSAGFDREKPMN